MVDRRFPCRGSGEGRLSGVQPPPTVLRSSEILPHGSNSKQGQRESHRTGAENGHPRSVLHKQGALVVYCVKEKKSKGRAQRAVCAAQSHRVHRESCCAWAPWSVGEVTAIPGEPTPAEVLTGCCRRDLPAQAHSGEKGCALRAQWKHPVLVLHLKPFVSSRLPHQRRPQLSALPARRFSSHLLPGAPS